jgi:hypothetical protein
MSARLALIAIASPVLICAAGCRVPGAVGDSVPPLNSGLSFIHPVQKPDDALVERCRRVSPEQKQRIHIFACNGLDPFCLGNLNGFCHAVRSLGFENIYFGQLWEPATIERKIVAVKQGDPAAAIILIGYSAGANDARRICNRLKQQSIRIELLAYLGGDTIRDVPDSRPENAQRVLNITGHGFALSGGDLFFNGEEISGATNARLDERHILLPSRSSALDIFLVQVAEISGAPRD